MDTGNTVLLRKSTTSAQLGLNSCCQQLCSEAETFDIQRCQFCLFHKHNCILILFLNGFFSKSGFGDCPRVQIFLQSLQDFSSTSIFFLKVHWKYKKIFLLSDLHITQVSPRAVFCSFLTFLFHVFAQVQKVTEENDEQMIS